MLRLSLDEMLLAEIEVYRLDFDWRDDASHAWAVLDRDERMRAERYVQRADRIRFTVTRAAVRNLLAQRLDCNPSEVRFGLSDTGKPHVMNHSPSPHVFNVTHSGKHALVAIADARRIAAVGVDLEYCGDGADINEVAEIAFSSPELDALRSAIDPDAAMYAAWTGKEAVLKAIGAGIADHLKSVSIGVGTYPSLSVQCTLPGWASLEAMMLPAPQQYAAALAWKIKESV